MKWKPLKHWLVVQASVINQIDDKVFQVSVNFQFLQKTHFKSPRSAADHLFTNIES